MANVLRQKRLKMLSKNPFCHWCKGPLTEENSTVEHLTPRSKGGSNANENLALSHPHCNRARGSTENPIKARKKIQLHNDKLKRDAYLKSITPAPTTKPSLGAGYSLGSLLSEAGIT